MSIHPSLSASGKNKKPRSILKRIERIRIMLEKNQWKEGDEVYGLPKIKTIRIKIKKEKTKEAVETAPVEGAIPAAPAETKEQPAKGPASKTQEKK